MTSPLFPDADADATPPGTTAGTPLAERMRPRSLDEYVGQAQIMTPAGALPLSFEIDATTLAEACERFAAGAKVAFEETMQELQEMRRQQASSIVIPDAGAASALAGQGGMPPRGKIQIP